MSIHAEKNYNNIIVIVRKVNLNKQEINYKMISCYDEVNRQSRFCHLYSSDFLSVNRRKRMYEYNFWTIDLIISKRQIIDMIKPEINLLSYKITPLFHQEIGIIQLNNNSIFISDDRVPFTFCCIGIRCNSGI